ncbi:MAG: VanZ family protein [Bacilli bacterium]|nr:VanZ family protein [Bacilli bacterium]
MLRGMIKFILIVLCMLLIFSFSTDNSEESSSKSDGLIVKISEIFTGRKLKENERNKYIDKYVVLVRKSAHFTIYLILGLLILSFIREFRVVDYRAVLLSVFLTFLYACSDEVHQLFVPGRSGEFLDVLLDSVGALSGCLLYTLYYKIRRKLYE